jgi:hypothetical protein
MPKHEELGGSGIDRKHPISSSGSKTRRHPQRGCLLPQAAIPKEQSQRLRRTIKGLFRRSTCRESLESRLRLANPVLRGWANFYRHAWGAKRVFVANDHYVWWTIHRWLRKKHPKTRMRDIYAQYGWRKPRGRMIRWRDGDTHRFTQSTTRVRAFRLAWQKPPAFASTSMESPVRIERRTGFGEGRPETDPVLSRARRRTPTLRR